jgi:hypothetical protein
LTKVIKGFKETFDDLSAFPPLPHHQN